MDRFQATCKLILTARPEHASFFLPAVQIVVLGILTSRTPIDARLSAPQMVPVTRISDAARPIASLPKDL